MEVTIKKLYSKASWIKENLNIILIIPAVIGGLWQLLELASISFAYIRYFSISQVVPDGLLVLLVILIVYLCSKAPGYFLDFIKFKRVENPNPRTFWVTVIGFLFTYSISGYELYNQYLNDKFLSPGYLIFIYFCVLFFVTLFFRLLPKNYVKYFERYINSSQKDEKSDKVIRSFTSVLNLVIAGVFLFLLYKFIIALSVYRSNFIQYDKGINVEKLKAKINKSDSTLYFNKILYSSDKYIFLDTRDTNQKQFIKVFKSDDLITN